MALFRLAKAVIDWQVRIGFSGPFTPSIQDRFDVVFALIGHFDPMVITELVDGGEGGEIEEVEITRGAGSEQAIAVRSLHSAMMASNHPVATAARTGAEADPVRAVEQITAVINSW